MAELHRKLDAKVTESLWRDAQLLGAGMQTVRKRKDFQVRSR